MQPQDENTPRILDLTITRGDLLTLGLNKEWDEPFLLYIISKLSLIQQQDDQMGQELVFCPSERLLGVAGAALEPARGAGGDDSIGTGADGATLSSHFFSHLSDRLSRC